MIRTNVERNGTERTIVKLWEQGLSVKEITSQLAIPRSTVGYYVRKFNQYGKAPDEAKAIQRVLKPTSLSDITFPSQESKSPSQLEKIFPEKRSGK